MKFNPTSPSVILALNMETEEEELRVLRWFYSKEPTKLVGYWEGKEERSYQLDSKYITDERGLRIALLNNKQKAFISISHGGGAVLQSPAGLFEKVFLGYMLEYFSNSGNCTYCPTSKTYWKAVGWTLT
tara:strand:+ start:293 stop:679 length:387 start_codon:yes stop_codon:yes gene_type:complete